MIKRILVTGSAGFTGKYVCKQLKEFGYSVFGLTNSGSIEEKSIDICDKDAVYDVVKKINPQAVIHLAAIPYVDHGQESELERVNVWGTVNLLNAIENYAKEAHHIVLASSANIYGVVNSPNPIKESVAPNPQNAYAESKLKMEEEVLRRFNGMPLTIVRPFNYTGVGQSERFIVPKIVNAFIRRDNVLDLGNINVSRDFSDIRFVSTAYQKIISKEKGVGIVNICSGRSISLEDIVRFCCNFSKHDITINSRSELRRNSEIYSLCGDPGKLETVIGSLSPFTFYDTLTWMLTSS